MKRLLAVLVLLAMPFAMLGCSDGGGSSPPDNQAHPTDWIKNHSEEATATADFSGCISCHGVDLKGNDGAGSCFYCHSYNTSPPFIIHPDTWTDVYANHRGYAAVNGSSTCAGCHGSDLDGSLAAPSCFAETFDGRGCHADGPGQTPHLIDGSYLDGAAHGPDAVADLAICHVCHGEPGGAGTNPRFNIGIDRLGGTGCEVCHGVNYAHPDEWSGQGALTHDQVGNIENACTLCHGADLEGGVGVSCLDCHGVAPVAANASGCISCHGEPPDSALPVGNFSPNRLGQHSHVRWTREGETCSRCHNGAGFGTDLHYDETNPANVNFLRPDDIDTITAVSTDTNTTCTGVCHIVYESDSGPINFTYPHSGLTWY